MNQPIHKINPDGIHEWLLDGKRHREDGPAFIYTDGRQDWYRHGECHREDGPAIITTNGGQCWYLSGKRIYSIKEYQEQLNLSGEDVTVLILKYGDIK